MIKSRKQMYLVIGAFALVLMLGTVTYAFFNYTRTGTANTIRVGRIAFNTSQASGQDGAINLSNAFPITRTLAATDTTNAGEVVITITGDTTYSGGVEYLVTATDVTNTVNSKTVPISIIATASNGLGTSDDSYFTNRGGNSSIYKVLANETVSNNDQLLVGYIAPDNNQTGVNGTITIRAYLDSDLVVISDTYNNGNTPTDNLGTPASFGENKTVLTTSEWNSLRTNGVSFKVKVVAQEGRWVDAPVVPEETPLCPGEKCVYSSTYEQLYTKWNTLNETPTVLSVDDYSTNYQEVLIDGDHSFYGLVLNNNSEIERAYLCGLKDDTTLFCIEGVESKKEQNKQFLNSDTLWNNTCAYGPDANSDVFYCPGVWSDELTVWVTDESIGSSDGWYLYYNGSVTVS